MSPRLSISAAKVAIKRAREVRARWRGRDAPIREDELRQVLLELQQSSRPIRSFIGRLSYETWGEITDNDLRETSAVLQKERRKIRKMLK